MIIDVFVREQGLRIVQKDDSNFIQVSIRDAALVESPRERSKRGVMRK
jgi:hypothetical protein